MEELFKKVLKHPLLGFTVLPLEKASSGKWMWWDPPYGPIVKGNELPSSSVKLSTRMRRSRSIRGATQSECAPSRPSLGAHRPCRKLRVWHSTLSMHCLHSSPAAHRGPRSRGTSGLHFPTPSPPQRSLPHPAHPPRPTLASRRPALLLLVPQHTWVMALCRRPESGSWM